MNTFSRKTTVLVFKDDAAIFYLIFASSCDLDVEESDLRRNKWANVSAVLLAVEKNLKTIILIFILIWRTSVIQFYFIFC
jgi:hypothetical protein